ncbi:MAG: hypothetical protein DMD48_07935 [Gemmatimonadetes bacterium]|nr:MAG: hypothetical protein DMD48_07935 [Gemmatimonadota bacterium]
MTAQEPLPLGTGQTDPWGMKRVENLITGLTGVLSARVVVTPLGEVSEVHVLTKSDIAPKQVVRNIESALMAQLGFKIDHRKISVAQTADVRPIEALQGNRVEAAARATATCLDDLLPDNSVALEGAQIIEAFDRKFVLVAVHGLGGREAQLLTGTCEIRESAERSAVLAVLDATNRWVDARR